MLRKYFWQFVGAILALAAIYATYDVFIRSRPSKGLHVTIDTVSPLVSVNPQAAGDIQVIYNGKVVTNATLLQVTIKNTGNQPIIESDYSKPLSFNFAPQDEILDVSIITSVPLNIGMDISKTSGYQATAKPVLLNPGDNISIRFIVATSSETSAAAHMNIDGRIAGVKNIILATPQKASTSILPDIAAAVLGVVATMVSVFVNERFMVWFRHRRKGKILIAKP